MESLLPSEVARLVLGYLQEENCEMAAQCFLTSSSHLSEYRSMAQKGKKYPTKVNGYTLKELLEEYCQVHSMVQESLSSMTEQPDVGGSMIDCLRFLVRACQPVQVHINLHPQQGQNSSSSKSDCLDSSNVSSRPRSRKTTLSQGQSIDIADADPIPKLQSDLSSIAIENSPSKRISSQNNTNQSMPEQSYMLQSQSIRMTEMYNTASSQRVDDNGELSSTENLESSAHQESALLHNVKRTHQGHGTLQVPHQEMFQDVILQNYREPSHLIPSQTLPESNGEGRNFQEQPVLISNPEPVQQISNNEVASQDVIGRSLTLESDNVAISPTKSGEPVRSYTVTQCYGSNIVILESDENLPHSNLPSSETADSNDRNDLRKQTKHKQSTPTKAKVDDTKVVKHFSKKLIGNEVMMTKLVDNINRIWTPIKESSSQDDSKSPASGTVAVAKSIVNLKETEDDFDQFLQEYLQFDGTDGFSSDEDSSVIGAERRRKEICSAEEKCTNETDYVVVSDSPLKQPPGNLINNDVPFGTTPMKGVMDSDTMTPMSKLLKSITSPSGELYLDPIQYSNFVPSLTTNVSPEVLRKQTELPSLQLPQHHQPSTEQVMHQHHQPQQQPQLQLLQQHYPQQLQLQSCTQNEGSMKKILQLAQPNGTMVNVPILICNTNQQVAQYVNEKGVSTICEIKVRPHGPFVPIVPKLQPGAPNPAALMEAYDIPRPSDPIEKKKSVRKHCRTRGGRHSGGQMHSDVPIQPASNDTMTIYAANSNVAVSSTMKIGGSSDLPILVSIPEDTVPASNNLEIRKEGSPHKEPTEDKHCGIMSDEKLDESLAGDKTADSNGGGETDSTTQHADCETAPSQTAPSNNCDGASEQIVQNNFDVCAVEETAAGKDQGNIELNVISTTHGNIIQNSISEDSKEVKEVFDSDNKEAGEGVHNSEEKASSTVAGVPEEGGMPQLNVAVVRNTPGVNGPIRSLDKRLSLSTPRRRSSHIRALDFNTPPKEDDISMRKANTSPKTMSTNALSPHTSRKASKSCGRPSLFKAPNDGTKRTSKVKAHLFKSPEYAMSLSSGFNVPHAAVTSTPSELDNPCSPFQRPSAAWDKVVGVSLILDSDEVSPMKSSLPSTKKAVFKSWDADLRSNLGCIEEEPSTSKPKRKTPPTTSKKPVKRIKKEPKIKVPKAAKANNDELNKSKNISTESECDMAKLIEENLMNASLESVSSPKKTSPSKCTNSSSSPKSEVLDIEDNIIAYHIEKDSAVVKSKDEEPFSDESSTSIIPLKTGCSVSPGSELTEDAGSGGDASQTNSSQVNMQATHSIDSPEVGESKIEQSEPVCERRLHVSDLVPASAATVSQKVRLSQEMLKESFSYDTPVKIDLLNVIPQTPRFLSPNSGINNEDTPRTKIIKSLPFPLVPPENSAPTPTVPTTPTIRRTPSVSPCGSSYFEPVDSSVRYPSSKMIEDCITGNISLQECSKIEAGGTCDFKSKHQGTSLKNIIAPFADQEYASEANEGDAILEPVEKRTKKRREISEGSRDSSTKKQIPLKGKGCARSEMYEAKLTPGSPRMVKNLDNPSNKIASSGDDTDVSLVSSPIKVTAVLSNEPSEETIITNQDEVKSVPTRMNDIDPSSSSKSSLSTSSTSLSIPGQEGVEETLDRIHSKKTSLKKPTKSITSPKSLKEMPLSPVVLSSLEQKQTSLNVSTISAASSLDNLMKNVPSKAQRKAFSTPVKISPPSAKKKVLSAKKKLMTRIDVDEDSSDESSASTSSSSSSDSDTSSSSSSSSEEGTPVKENVSPTNVMTPRRTRSQQASEAKQINETMAAAVDLSIETEDKPRQCEDQTDCGGENVIEEVEEKGTHFLKEKDEALPSDPKHIEFKSLAAHNDNQKINVSPAETLIVEVNSQTANTSSGMIEDMTVISTFKITDLTCDTEKKGSEKAKSRRAHVSECVASFQSELALKRNRMVEQLKKNNTGGRCTKSSTKKTTAVVEKQDESKICNPEIIPLVKEAAEKIDEQGTKDSIPSKTCKEISKKTRSKSEPDRVTNDTAPIDECVKPRSLSDSAGRFSDDDEEFKLHLSGDEKEETIIKPSAEQYDPVEQQIAALHGDEDGVMKASPSTMESKITVCEEVPVLPESNSKIIPCEMETKQPTEAHDLVLNVKTQAHSKKETKITERKKSSVLTETNIKNATSERESKHFSKATTKSAVSSKSADKLLKNVLEKGLGCPLKPPPTGRIKKISPNSKKALLESKSQDEYKSDPCKSLNSESLPKAMDKPPKGNYVKQKCFIDDPEVARCEVIDTGSSNKMELILTYEGLGNVRPKINTFIPESLQYLLDEGSKLTLFSTSFFNLYSVDPSDGKANVIIKKRSNQSSVSKQSEKKGVREHSDVNARERRSSGETTSGAKEPKRREERRFRRNRTPSPRHRRGRDYSHDPRHQRDNLRSQDYCSQQRNLRKRSDGRSPHGRKRSDSETRCGDLNSRTKSRKNRDTEEGELLSSDDEMERDKNSSSKSRNKSSCGKQKSDDFRDRESGDRERLKKSRMPLSDRLKSRNSEGRHPLEHRPVLQPCNSSPQKERRSVKKQIKEDDDHARSKRINDHSLAKELDDDNFDDNMEFPILGEDETDQRDSKNSVGKSSHEDDQFGAATRRRAPPRSVNAHKNSGPESTTQVVRGKRKLSTSVDEVSEESCQSSLGSENLQRRLSKRFRSLVSNASAPATKISKPTEGGSIPVTNEVVKNLDVESFLSKIHGQD